MNKITSRKISFEDLRTFCFEAYTSVGVPEDEAETVSDLLVRSDLRGIESHGITRLPIYIQRLEKDYVRKVCQFEVLKAKGATAYINAHGSQGHLVADRAMKMAINLAEEHGIGFVSVKDSGHFGIAGLFPLMAAQKGMIGHLCSNSAPMMAAYGGKERVMGNNPLSYAFPADKHLPVVVDFSCTVVASGRLILMRKKGEKIPLGWAVDKDGLPTEDPYAGYEGGGSLAPLGAHKGYGLAMAHEMMTALLTGGKVTSSIKSLYEEDDSGIQGTCHSFMVVDPDCFIGRQAFMSAMDSYIDNIKNSGRAKDVEEILVPGEPEARVEAKRMVEGIELNAATSDELNRLGNRLGIKLPEMD